MNFNHSHFVCLFFVGMVVVAVVAQMQKPQGAYEDYALNGPIVGEMQPAIQVPDDRSKIHPWMKELLEKDRAGVAEAIEQRMTNKPASLSGDYAAITKRFAPHRIIFSGDVGYVQCLKRSCRNVPSYNVTDYFYVRQPWPDEKIAKNVLFFDPTIRSQMTEFLSKLGGCGEEMPGMCGQFEACDYFLSDIWGDVPQDSPWKDAPILYVARNGDTVLVNQHGITVWFVSDTADMIALCKTIPEFIQHYAEFRQTGKVFDSYSSLELLGRNPWY